jgi:hypothetical protein
MLSDLPSWAVYKAALARIARAGARLMDRGERCDPGARGRMEAEFVDALRAYDGARSELARVLGSVGLHGAGLSDDRDEGGPANLPGAPAERGERSG